MKVVEGRQVPDGVAGAICAQRYEEKDVDLSRVTDDHVYMPEPDELEARDTEKEIAEFPMDLYPGRIFVQEEVIIKTRGLYVPEDSRHEGEMRTNTGVVIAVGEGVDFVKPGDRVYYGRFSGAWVMGMKYRLMAEKDLIGRYKTTGNGAKGENNG